MRKIKFRAKRSDDGVWVYGDLTHVQKICSVEENNKTGKYTIPVVRVAGYDVDEETIGQFTSLYCCHGKEIYEGDILDFNGLKIEVRFVRGVFALLYNGDLDQEMCRDCRTDLFAKIIGNIHDNAELLN